MNKILFCVALALIIDTASAQNEISGSVPAVGWDSLKAMIVYPEIAQRAGFQATVTVTVEFDTAGAVRSVLVRGFDMFESPVVDAVKNVRWVHKNRSADGRIAPVYFSVEFVLTDQEHPGSRTLRIEKGSPVIRRNPAH